MTDLSAPLLIASDHAGFGLKQALQMHLKTLKWMDLGTDRETASVDYPQFALRLCQAIQKGQAPLGILICGSGIGMSIAANKCKGIRAALVENPVSARFAREHNHANVLCLGGRFLAAPYAAEIVQSWLLAKPLSEARHLQRITQLSQLESESP